MYLHISVRLAMQRMTYAKGHDVAEVLAFAGCSITLNLAYVPPYLVALFVRLRNTSLKWASSSCR